jgi:flagellar basal body rod protein FlgB
MIKALFGSSSVPHALRKGLDHEMKIHRQIAARIATALQASTSSGFQESLEKATGAQRPSETDLQNDMAALSNAQVRYEAEAKLLKGAYGSIRRAIGGE